MALGGEAPESCGINARATHANPTLSASSVRSCHARLTDPDKSKS